MTANPPATQCRTRAAARWNQTVKSLPLPWLMGFALCGMLVIAVPAASILYDGIKQAAYLVERSLDKATQNKINTKALADALTEKVYPAQKLAVAARNFVFETEMALMDPERARGSLDAASKALHDVVSRWAQVGITMGAENRARMDEFLGVLVDVAVEVEEAKSPRQLQQLLYDSREALEVLGPTIDALLGTLRTDVLRQSRQAVENAEQSADSALNELVAQRAQTRNLLNLGGTILALLIVVFAAATIGFYRVVANRLNYVSLYSRRLAAGDYNSHLDLNVADVIGQVARDVEHMGENLARQVLESAQQARLAEQASRAKSAFLANMSHEVRTPINGVLGMTELLLKTNLDGKQRRFAKTVRRSGETLLRVLNDILDFSKIEAGKLELQDATFNLRELVEDIGELFAESAQGKGLELVCEVPPRVDSFFRGDSGRLRQILSNLTMNAIKFTEHGEVVVRVASVDTDGEFAQFRFEVEDTGIGIAADLQARIFESFSQADSSTERRYGGTGLGLTISAQLSELMGGGIGVDSELGKGSTFWFTVRLRTEASIERSPPGDRALAGVRVLIVDDNATNREILANQLSSWQVSYECTCSGHEALRAMRESAAEGRPFELAILDMHMPEMDGIALSLAMNDDPGLASIHRVLLSSVCDQLGAKEFKGAGFDAYLTKPVRQSELYNCLASMMEFPVPVTHISSKNSGTAGSEVTAFEGRILLAEDNLVNQEVALGMLEPMGVEITVVEDGRAAVEAWSGEHFDLVLMDCQMPDLDGYGATREIRRQESINKQDRIPIIALTANALQGDRESCLESGMDDYLSKPFSESQLHDILSRWLPAPNQAPAAPEMAGHESAIQTAATTQSNTGSHDAVPLLDTSVLDLYRERERRGRKNLLGRIIGAYLSQAPQHIEQLRDAVSNGDPASVQAAAHTLKSSSANVGALGFSEICAELETLGRARTLEGLGERLDEVDMLFTRVRDALAEECAESAS